MLSKTSLRSNTKGAALVEYSILIAALAIGLTALTGFGEKITELFENPEPLDPGLTEIIIPGCVETGQCAPPPELLTYCIENTQSGEFCDEARLVVIHPPGGPSFVVPVSRDPELPYALSDRNEDFPDAVYANTPNSTVLNNAEIMEHTAYYSHPGGEFCNANGGLLPSVDAMHEMAPYHDRLNLHEAQYLTSSQYWATGYGYNPAPVLAPINYVRVYQVDDFARGLNPYSHGFVTFPFFVRCIFQ